MTERHETRRKARLGWLESWVQEIIKVATNSLPSPHPSPPPHTCRSLWLLAAPPIKREKSISPLPESRLALWIALANRMYRNDSAVVQTQASRDLAPSSPSCFSWESCDCLWVNEPVLAGGTMYTWLRQPSIPSQQPTICCWMRPSVVSWLKQTQLDSAEEPPGLSQPTFLAYKIVHLEMVVALSHKVWG